MIKEFIEKWGQGKDKLYEKFFAKEPDGYSDIVKEVIMMINPQKKYNLPYHENITCIDGESYQGTNLYIIRTWDLDSKFWYVFVDYGSCSGCDSSEAILASDDSKEQKTKDFVTLAMHIVQSIKLIEEE